MWTKTFLRCVAFSLLAFTLCVDASVIFEPQGVKIGSSTSTTTKAPSPGEKEDVDDAGENANAMAVTVISQRRLEHGSAAITYDPALRELAKGCADHYQIQGGVGQTDPVIISDFPSQCLKIGDANEALFHVDKTEAEQNLVFANKFDELYSQGKDVWKYAEPSSKNLEQYQIFTQMLWKASTKVGCACDPVFHSATQYICSCLFSPAGNRRTGFGDAGLEEYKTNVLPRK